MTSPEPDDDTRRILLADDNFGSRELLTRLLRQFTRAELHEVRDGAAALASFHLLRPQITLLDIDMPEPDGMTVLEQIRAAGSEAFVVMVSGHSKLDMVRRAVELGVGGFVVKPYSAQRVVEVLQNYVAKTGDRGLLKEVA
jgi:two-component system chemotaxis response regulator CheY